MSSSSCAGRRRGDNNRITDRHVLVGAVVWIVVGVALKHAMLVDAFGLARPRSLSRMNHRPVSARSSLKAAPSDSDSSTTLVKSGRKEIGYDESTGRFFETSLEEEDCVPTDEYCVVDKESGKLIRLTMQEKERIFLDALQVSLSLSSLSRCRSPCTLLTSSLSAWCFSRTIQPDGNC
jgi:hypothetical protein